MEMLNEFGVKTPKGGVARTPQEAYDVAAGIGMLDYCNYFLTGLALSNEVLSSCPYWSVSL